MNSGNGLNSCGCHRGIVLEYNHGLKEGASSMEENQGMTDGQYGDHLRAVIADLERIKKLGVSEEAEAEIDSIIARYCETIG